MTDLSSVAREAALPIAERIFVPLDRPTSVTEHVAVQSFIDGFTECASRLPSEEEFGAVVLKHFHGPDELHSSWWINTEEMGAAIAALIGEKISG